MLKFYGITPDLYISPKVALVGNSNNLLNKRYGSLIDSFDTVIRFNYGDLFKDTTGFKTTIRWINCPIDVASAQEHNRSIKTMGDVANYTKKLFDGTSVICWESLQKKMQEIDKTFKFYSPNEMCVFGNINSYLATLGVKHKFDVVPNCWPRTGFQAILTCIRSGTKPHLFGFDMEQHKIIKHYSQNNEYIISKMTQHQVDNEIIVLRELEKLGLIVVHK